MRSTALADGWYLYPDAEPAAPVAPPVTVAPPAPSVTVIRGPAWISERLHARSDARARGDYATADAIRAELEADGVEVADTPSGLRWRLAGSYRWQTLPPR